MGGEKPKSPSRATRAAPAFTRELAKGPPAKSIPVGEESASRSDMACLGTWGGKARTGWMGMSSPVTAAAHAAASKVDMAGGLQRSSAGPPMGSKARCVEARKPN